MMLLAGVLLAAAALPAISAPVEFVLQRGPLPRQGLPVSNRDTSEYLYAVYRGAGGSVEVALADTERLQGSIRQGSWERRACNGHEYYSATRYGLVFLVPVEQADLLIWFPAESYTASTGCSFLGLLMVEMAALRGQPDFNRDPFPALLPMPR
ncbi:hypothetical protein [Spirochaeta africana]|uniref:Uncharacterized protein n=1 Tax=Spirochaeta africana (strain ATCC 700263 / DSM 8902 / Z-7692) TaxID=889378 RepID=H9UM29_SPIAZ|nr:hypothetical protein [Spirochaeta africana]AFG38572.1 hypothetical protein Spiaf_2542 [Spirochaeta africana DSM 8902]